MYKIKDVKIINRYAFQGCIDLLRINIPLETRFIGDFTFHNCHSLKSVTINSRHISIQQYSFDYYNKKLKFKTKYNEMSLQIEEYQNKWQKGVNN